jgi:copper homeostasis protein CutC
MLLEVIVQTLADAREALRGGADRLEIVRAIADDGLTPPLSLVRAIATETSRPLRVMVRENTGFETTAAELSRLRRAAEEFHTLGVDGLVLGFARGGEPLVDDTRRVLEAVPSIRATFHRAFDEAQDPLSAIDRISALPQIDRILTSGGDGPVETRCERLRAYVAHAAGRVEIIAGGNITEDMVALIARTGCVREVHVGRAARAIPVRDAPVSAARVKQLKASLVAQG